MSDVVLVNNEIALNNILVPTNVQSAALETKTNEIIYVPVADKYKFGVVREGDGIKIKNGIVSLDKSVVESMIDANAWISYGFYQNLTEEQKGVARHNIGAGAADFSGSYLDLTQKPILNTDNKESLEVSPDELLINTIQLHKISKTGSFNDLNDTPSIVTTDTDQTITGNKTFTPNENTEFSVTDKLIDQRVAGNGVSLFQVHDNGTSVIKYAQDIQKTSGLSVAGDGITFLSSGNDFENNVNLNEDGFKYNDSSVVTENNETIKFAENERQKSKNLFKVNNYAGYSVTRYGVTITVNEDYTITLNGTVSGTFTMDTFNGLSNSADHNPYQPLYLDINKTYSYVLKRISGTATSGGFGVHFRRATGTSSESKDLAVYYEGEEISYTTQSGNDYWNNGFLRATGGTVFNDFTVGIMVCEGEDTDFQSWNGEILHKKDIQRHIIQCYLSSKTYLSNAYAYEALSLTLNNQIGNKLTLQDNKIYIGAGITKVSINGCVQYIGTNEISYNLYCYASIAKNGSNVYYLANGYSSSGFSLISFSPMIIDVAEGDYIELKGYVTNVGTSIEAGRQKTFIKVEVVE